MASRKSSRTDNKVDQTTRDQVILCIPDMHAPFQHPDTLEFLCTVRDKYQPTEVVVLGDELDMHSLSDYEHDPDGYSAGQELEAALFFMHKLYKEFPVAKVCTSNHTSRPYRKAYRFGIPAAYLRDYREFLQAPDGWEWRDKWIIDGIQFEHGESFLGESAGLKHARANMRSTVIGHQHTNFSIDWFANSDSLLFGLDCGCLIDIDSYAFNYSKKLKKKPILGVAVIIKNVPHLIPMPLDTSGRLVGRKNVQRRSKGRKERNGK